MKFSVLIIFIIVIMTSSCEEKKESEAQNRWKKQAERAKVFNEQWGNLAETYTWPETTNSNAVTISTGSLLKTELSPQQKEIVSSYENKRKEFDKAGQDSTTSFGTLLKRTDYESATQKNISASYDYRTGKLIHFYIEEGIQHKSKWEYYFDNSILIYAKHKQSEHNGDSVVLTEDHFFIKDKQVIYTYRDKGSKEDKQKGGVISFINTERYTIQGDVDAHIAMQFDSFKKEHTTLQKNKKLEINLYIK